MTRATILITFFALVSGAAALTVAADSDFTYQGFLADGGAPAEGSYDLRFRIFDVPSGGADLGLVEVDDHPVSDGRLTVDLDFGEVADVRAFWLQLEVRPGASTGAHTVLSPRQPVTVAPHALTVGEAGVAMSAGSAASAGDADMLGGMHGIDYRMWSNLTGVPAGLNDGDDDVLGDLDCHEGDVATWNGSMWSCDADDGGVYVRTTVVNAGPDGLVNGAALVAAVEAAPTPASQTGAWHVRLEPGVYDLDDLSLVTKPWMVLEGSGRETTVVISSACSETAFPASTVVTEADSEVRDLTVVSSCSSPTGNASAVTVGGDRSRLTRVAARTEGTSDVAIGVWVYGAGAILEEVTVSAVGDPGWNVGIEIFGEGALLLDCEVETNDSGDRTALLVGGSSRIMGGRYELGYLDGDGETAIDIAADAEFYDVSVIAAVTGRSVKLEVPDAGIVVTMSRVDLQGRLQAALGPGDTASLILEHSRISADGATITGDTGAVIAVGSTMLDGLPVDPGGGVVVCAGVWDESWAFSPNVCP